MATISSSATTFSGEVIAAILSIVVAGAGTAVLLTSRRSIGETTLRSAWWWTLGAILGWSGVELLAACFETSLHHLLQPLRLAAIGLSFCPAVSLIGAKRPQHAAWNFVVLSLWAIVVLPSAETIFLRPGQPVEMGDARGWFLWLLILLGPINFVPTRHWLAAFLLAAGQVIALGQYLPLIHRDLGAHSGLVGLALAGAGIVTARLVGVVANLGRSGSKTLQSYDRMWLDFRDCFGLFWSLRVQERVNAAAKQYGWDLDLGWSGFKRRSDGAPLAAIDPDIEPTFRTMFKGLLRRFVSHPWIAHRQPPGLD